MRQRAARIEPKADGDPVPPLPLTELRAAWEGTLPALFG